MTDTQYGYIQEKFPKWAKHVEEVAAMLCNDAPGTNVAALDTGCLFGLAAAMTETGQLSEAFEFVSEAINRARTKKEQGVTA